MKRIQAMQTVDGVKSASKAWPSGDSAMPPLNPAQPNSSTGKQASERHEPCNSHKTSRPASGSCGASDRLCK
jgi:hypothetical protein